MIEVIEKVNSIVNDFIWGVPTMVLILGVGLLLSIGTGFVQIRKFGYAMKSIFRKLFQKSEAANGSMTSFQAVCTALAATVGTGNIAGVAGAIAIGGPGAVFWMWISALLGMCTKFSEVVLAVKFREKNKKGDYVGGPMYYIKNGLGKKWIWLAYLFAVFCILATFGIGNTTQVNTIVTSIDTALQNYNLVSDDNLATLNLLLGIGIAIITGMVLFGGIKRIGSVTEKLVPFMALFYILLSFGVIFANITRLPDVFGMIFEGAFNPSAVTGGIVGSILLSMKNGISRGIFSNEAGLGSGSIAHACADTDEPVKQGFFGIFEVFVDTIVICTLTALVILCSGVDIAYGSENVGAELTIASFISVYGGWVTIFIAIAICCFAFSTVIGWGLYGARCLEFIASEKAIKPFVFLFALATILGATMDLGLIWKLADTFNGLMVVPNLIALLFLSGTVFKTTKDFFTKNQ